MRKSRQAREKMSRPVVQVKEQQESKPKKDKPSSSAKGPPLGQARLLLFFARGSLQGKKRSKSYPTRSKKVNRRLHDSRMRSKWNSVSSMAQNESRCCFIWEVTASSLISLIKWAPHGSSASGVYPLAANAKDQFPQLLPPQSASLCNLTEIQHVIASRLSFGHVSPSI